MKKLTLLAAIALVFFYGCDKQETIPSEELLPTDGKALFMNVLVINGETASWETVSVDDQLETSVSSTLKQSNSAHTHGSIHGLGGPGVTTFSGTQNNGGAHGSAEIQFTGLHILLETSSVVVLGNDENEAVYGGLITEVLVNTLPPPPPPPPGAPPMPCSPFDVGSYVYFYVKDNGQGNNAPDDQYKSVLLPPCNAIPDGGATFPWFFFPWSDVSDPSDKIKVNN